MTLDFSDSIAQTKENLALDRELIAGAHTNRLREIYEDILSLDLARLAAFQRGDLGLATGYLLRISDLLDAAGAILAETDRGVA